MHWKFISVAGLINTASDCVFLINNRLRPSQQMIKAIVKPLGLKVHVRLRCLSFSTLEKPFPLKRHIRPPWNNWIDQWTLLPPCLIACSRSCCCLLFAHRVLCHFAIPSTWHQCHFCSRPHHHPEIDIFIIIDIIIITITIFFTFILLNLLIISALPSTWHQCHFCPRPTPHQHLEIASLVCLSPVNNLVVVVLFLT